MAKEEGKKEEEKFEFTPEGEVLGYISMEQARVLAMENARDNPDFYGVAYRGATLIREVISEEDGDDYYDITFSFRPAGPFQGRPGKEQFIIDKLGTIRVKALR